MAIHNIHSIEASQFSPSIKKNLVKPSEAQISFSNFLKKSIEEVNNAQIQSDVMTKKLVNGEDIDLHQVMITSQKAGITLQATMEVRNKVVEAYQEVMRMQV
ncbi:flagellar hook-basal body complex protein FliE [Bacillus pakistanensis]|uniref:Flagellar hook-basal body complex protein FliE n=1 Tax=Rossellomorea pakistanensis TaxID=992288 RepID=A0ABS2NG27_9BACI|nr:flagellar hook-basal body complex protein FliE [Bacillus pakistanensis]MBM7586828.1 flagellar hook-basal body complex protein FliE [Bacillus pakistanensis]